MSVVRKFNKNKKVAKATRAKPRYKKPAALPAGIEHKFYDSSGFDKLPNYDGDMDVGLIDPTSSTVISGPSQGDQANNRNGKQIVITTVIIEGIVKWPESYETYALRPNIVRPRVWIALIQDTQTNGANFFTGDALTNPTGFPVNCVIPLKNLYNAKRFITLKVWEFGHPDFMPSTSGIQSTGTSTGVLVFTTRVTQKFDCYLKVNIPVNFNNFVPTATQIGSVVDNSLHLVAFQDSSDDNFVANVDYNARIRFLG